MIGSVLKWTGLSLLAVLVIAAVVGLVAATVSFAFVAAVASFIVLVIWAVAAALNSWFKSLFSSG